jgi:hypothetical protein
MPIPRVTWFVVALGLVAGVSGCKNSPVYNVSSASFVTPAVSQRTLVDVRDAIVRGGKGLGWAMEDVAPGHLVGTLRLRSHVAVVDIDYTLSSFSIRYKDSKNLLYDGQTIHRNYNNWIHNLERAILKEL